MKYIISLLLIFFLSVCVYANDWSVIESDHFLVRYTRSLNTAKEIQNISENFYSKITDRLGFSISRKIDIWFCESKSEFLLANNAPIQDWASGAAYPLQSRIVILDPSFSENRRIDLNRLVKHEITHVVFGLYLGDNIANVPRWFNEGIAMYMSDDWGYGNYWTILTAVVGNSLLPLYSISEEFPIRAYHARIAYSQSYNIIDFIVKRYGEQALGECIKELANGRLFDEALANATGANIDWIESIWLRQLKKRYRWYSVISSFSVLWVGAVLILSIAYIKRKIKNHKIIKEWEDEEKEIYQDYSWTDYDDEPEDTYNDYEDDESDER